MTMPAAPTVLAPEQCDSCGGPLANDQRYCLHCGELRAGARRQMPALPRGSAGSSAADGVIAVTRESREGPTVAAVLAGLACLLAATGIGVLIGRGAGGEPSAQAPVAIAAPAATAFTSDWPAGTEGWTIALTLLPKATTTSSAVADAKTAATGKGVADVGALDADAYASLTTASYVVYSGVFDSEKAATAARSSVVAAFPAARVVRVGKTAAAPTSGTTGRATTAKPAGGAAAGKPDGGSDKPAADTTKEVEKSKKAPKTVGTGGTAPPKDDKPAAGGAGFEEIG